MEGLRQLCEEEFIQSLTSNTVINFNMLIHAVDHNAPDLKKAYYIEVVVHNTAAVRQSEGWEKLEEDQIHHDQRVELLENITEKSLTPNNNIIAMVMQSFGLGQPVHVHVTLTCFPGY